MRRGSNAGEQWQQPAQTRDSALLNELDVGVHGRGHDGQSDGLASQHMFGQP